MTAPTQTYKIHAVSIARHGTLIYQQVYTKIKNNDLFNGFLSALVNVSREFKIGAEDNRDLTFIEKRGYGFAVKDNGDMVYSIIFDWTWDKNSYKLHDKMRTYLKKIRLSFEETFPNRTSALLNNYRKFSEKLKEIFGQPKQPAIRIDE